MIGSLALALVLATGPSSATYRITPVAASARGAVLFRTWRELNRTGAHAVQRVEVGWLAVSADGLWREVPHAVVDPAELGDGPASERIDRLRAELAAPLDWADPPASVRPLLAELSLHARDAVDPSEGRGAATWSPRRACAHGRCARGVRQRTLGGIESEPGEGTAVRCTFLRGGVALFENGVDGEGNPRGATFPLPSNPGIVTGVGRVDLGYELVEVDGVAITPGSAGGGSRTRP